MARPSESRKTFVEENIRNALPGPVYRILGILALNFARSTS
jgi:hypothetical protein